jgi:hypothetical protein
VAAFADAYAAGEASDLVRLLPADGDEVVASEVARFSRLGESERAAYRLSVTGDDRVALTTFALRSTVRAMRTQSVAALLEATDAFAVPGSWSRGGVIRLRLPLYVAREFGQDLGRFESRFYDLATESLRHELVPLMESMNRVVQMRDIGFVEVSTSFGRGVIELPIELPMASSGWFGNVPRGLRAEAPYEPTAHLARAAIDIAAALAGAGGWIGRTLLVSSLSSAWFGELAVDETIPTTGCLLFSLGHPLRTDDPVMVWVAELTEQDTADELVSSLDSELAADGEVVAAGRGRLLILVARAPSFDDAFALPVDLTPLMDVAADVLTANTY